MNFSEKISVRFKKTWPPLKDVLKEKVCNVVGLDIYLQIDDVIRFDRFHGHVNNIFSHQINHLKTYDFTREISS